jgi:predicted metal-dependent hydrolase
MGMQLKFGEIVADVVKKDIKNIHLSVYPPTGAVRISAPTHMKTDTIRVFALSKIGWIKKQQKKLCEQERETPREYLERESHYLWGKRYLLAITEKNERPLVGLKHKAITLQVRPGASEAKKRQVLDEWYRQQLKDGMSPLIAVWEKRLNVTVDKFIVRKMKTMWGSCTPTVQTIRINMELSKKPLECLEYIIVHEMLHLIEPTHNARFVALMDQYLPKWQFYREELNRLPISHVDWKY